MSLKSSRYTPPAESPQEKQRALSHFQSIAGQVCARLRKGKSSFAPTEVEKLVVHRESSTSNFVVTWLAASNKDPEMLEPSILLFKDKNATIQLYLLQTGELAFVKQHDGAVYASVTSPFVVSSEISNLRTAEIEVITKRLVRQLGWLQRLLY